MVDGSASHAAGLREGDTILRVNDRLVHKWSDLRLEAAFHQEVTLLVRTVAGEERTLQIKTENGVLGEHQIPGIDGPDICMVMRVAEGMTAAKAGIQADDVIVKFNAQTVYSRGHLIELVRDSENRASEIVVKRPTKDGHTDVTLSVTPGRDEAANMIRIGIDFNLAAVEEGTIIRPRPMEQLRGHAMSIFRFLEALVTPKESKAATKAVGGPVAILVSYWYVVTTSPMLAIWFTGLLNVNLAILNLLPIPVLDGGHICFSLYEMVRRKPMNARFVNALVNAFAVLLISLILLITVRDVDRFTPAGRMVRGLFGAKKSVPEQAIPAAVTNGAVAGGE